MSKVYRNATYTKRDHECTNVVACVANAAPGPNWVECSPEILTGLTKLHRQGDAVFYGYL